MSFDHSSHNNIFGGDIPFPPSQTTSDIYRSSGAVGTYSHQNAKAIMEKLHPFLAFLDPPPLLGPRILRSSWLEMIKAIDVGQVHFTQIASPSISIKTTWWNPNFQPLTSVSTAFKIILIHFPQNHPTEKRNHLGMYQNQSCSIWGDEHPSSYLGWTEGYQGFDSYPSPSNFSWRTWDKSRRCRWPAPCPDRSAAPARRHRRLWRPCHPEARRKREGWRKKRGDTQKKLPVISKNWGIYTFNGENLNQWCRTFNEENLNRWCTKNWMVSDRGSYCLLTPESLELGSSRKSLAQNDMSWFNSEKKWFWRWFLMKRTKLV